MKGIIWRGVIASSLLAGLLATATTAASASPPSITVHGHRVTTPANLNSPASVEAFLLRVQAAQGSTSVAFLHDADVSPALRQAVIKTATRAGTPHIQTSSGRYTTTQMVAKFGTQQAAALAAAGWGCGWAQKTISYKPGVIQYYWLELHTDLCSNGSIIANTPSSWHNGGASWGWSYSTAWTQDQWFPYNTEWLSGVGANMTYAAVLAHNHPWIRFYDYANGYVTTQWKTT